MPDAMGQVQQAAVDNVADALARHRANAPTRRPGLTHCETLDCREPIEPQRTALGARLCEDCQREADIRARQYRGCR